MELREVTVPSPQPVNQVPPISILCKGTRYGTRHNRIDPFIEIPLFPSSDPSDPPDTSSRGKLVIDRVSINQWGEVWVQTSVDICNFLNLLLLDLGLLLGFTLSLAPMLNIFFQVTYFIVNLIPIHQQQLVLLLSSDCLPPRSYLLLLKSTLLPETFLLSTRSTQQLPKSTLLLPKSIHQLPK